MGRRRVQLASYPNPLLEIELEETNTKHSCGAGASIIPVADNHRGAGVYLQSIARHSPESP